MHRTEIKNLKDSARGKKVWVIGNGPSLATVDLSKIQGDIAIVCNRIYAAPMAFSPSFYCIEDKKLIRSFGSDISEWRVCGMVKFVPEEMEKFITGSDVIYVNFIYENKDWKFSEDFSEEVYHGWTVAYMMLQLAFYLGGNTFLLGMDCSSGHFVSEDVYYKGLIPNAAKWDYVFKGYEIALDRFKKKGILLANSTAGGNLEVVPRVSFEDALKM